MSPCPVKVCIASGGQLRSELIGDGHRVDVDRAVRSSTVVKRPHLEP